MQIETLELSNFRNYDSLHMDLNPGTNILYGDNAQGKTNILESIYLCATTKSHRGSKDRKSYILTGMSLIYGCKSENMTCPIELTCILKRINPRNRDQWYSNKESVRAFWYYKHCFLFSGRSEYHKKTGLQKEEDSLIQNYVNWINFI